MLGKVKKGIALADKYFKNTSNTKKIRTDKTKTKKYQYQSLKPLSKAQQDRLERYMKAIAGIKGEDY